MDAASLVISFIALVVSAGSAVFTYMQARSARHQVEIAREERHDDRRPRVLARYHMSESGGHEAITFINEGPVDIDNGALEVGTVGHQLVETIAGCPRVEHFAWPVGSGASYVIARRLPNAGIATFRLTCNSPDGRKWDVAVTCDLPERSSSAEF